MNLVRVTVFWWAAIVLGSGLAVARAGDVAAREPESPEQRAQRIAALIEQLGHEEYAYREQAQAELARYSFDAFDAISAAATHDDLEIAARARFLLSLMRVRWTTPTDPPEVQTLLAGYDTLSLAQKEARFAALAGLPEGQGVAVLCRLVRFEESLVLSKRAALALIASQPADAPPDAKLAESIRRTLGTSGRAGAQWLQTWTSLAADREAAVDAWNQFAEEETALLGRAPHQTDATIVAELLRFEIPWLKRLGRDDAVLEAIDRLVDVETGDLEALSELLAWLTEQKAWDAIDKLFDRFPTQFGSSPLLLYDVAQMLVDAGDPQRAEGMVGRALALNPGETGASTHYAVARVLWSRGQNAWAEREFRQAIDDGPAGNELGVVAASFLAEMYHDEGRDLEAGKELETLLADLEKQPGLAASITGELPSIRARMGFFLACHSDRIGDRDAQRKHLAEATAADPHDIDVLIARYRIPDPTPEYRGETMQLIEMTANEYRRDAASLPEDPTAHNQYAWLIANTEGDLDLALRHSKKSLELDPDNGAYLDTLAHVHFARGEYEQAVKAQTRAVEQEPNRKEIAKKLEVFRKKWEEVKASEGPAGSGG